MMTTHSGGEPIGPDPPRRSRLPILIPMSVAAMTLGLIGWSAWPTLKPVRAVAVTQAVFDRSSESTTQPATGPADDAGIDHSGATVQAPGWLEAEPFYVACTALADGVVETMEVLEGDRVEKGQVVARLVSEDTELLLQRREAELASAKSNLALAKAELQAAQTAWDEPIDLQRAVETSKAAVAERKAELEQLPSLIESAKATLVRLEEEFTRIQRLRDEGEHSAAPGRTASRPAESRTADRGPSPARGRPRDRRRSQG
jgi:multidrug efflux pump subunit AcrA (membrane-fusion protein)